MGKNRKDIRKNMFLKAGQKLLELRQGRILKSLVLAGVLLSQVQYPLDLIAEDVNGETIEKFGGGVEKNTTNFNKADAIEIQCKEGEENLAEFCRDVMLQVAMENNLTAEIFAKMADCGTVFEVGRESFANNGVYLIGQNKIDIPKNVISLAMKDDKALATLKNALRHEGVHFIQDMCGVFEDCKKLRPREVCIVYTMAELDAMIKATIMESPDVWNVNNGFSSFVDLVPMLYRYTDKALLTSKMNEVVPVEKRLGIADVMEKFNVKEFGEYRDMNYVVEQLQTSFKPEMKEKISVAEREYDERLMAEFSIGKSKIAMGKNKAGLRE